MVNEPKSFNDPHIIKREIKYKQREEIKDRGKHFWREDRAREKFSYVQTNKQRNNKENYLHNNKTTNYMNNKTSCI